MAAVDALSFLTRGLIFLVGVVVVWLTFREYGKQRAMRGAHLKPA